MWECAWVWEGMWEGMWECVVGRDGGMWVCGWECRSMCVCCELTFLKCTPPHNLPHDEGKGIDVNLLEGLEVMEVHTGIQRLWGHVAESPHL